MQKIAVLSRYLLCLLKPSLFLFLLLGSLQLGALFSFLGSLLIKLASLKIYLQFEALGLGLAGGVARVEFIQFMFLRLFE